MINYVKRNKLDVVKYDNCIENAIQSRVYAFSWYLDIVADNWDVLVLDDYEAVMPIPWKIKYGIKYVSPPLWVLELGVFSSDYKTDLDGFLNKLLKEFRFTELRMNSANEFSSIKTYLLEKQFQILSIVEDYDTVFNQYRKDRKKDLRKALKLDLVEKWNDTPEVLITLFKQNVGKRTTNVLENDYINLKTLIDACIERNVGEILSVYDINDNLVSSGFFLKHNNSITILVSSTDFKNRNNGANTYLIDRAIFRFQKNFNIFNFGGSSLQSIAKYFLSFGATTENYQQIKYNRLPFLLRLFKR